jgi:membrane protease YdiL (CAAX protease family)
MKRLNDCFWTLLFSLAAVGFALTAHRDAWVAWRWVFLAAAGAAICAGWIVLQDPIETIFGKRRENSTGWWIVLAVGLAVLAAVAYRRLLHEDYLPSALHGFALTAMGIGAVEELLWRGWMQGALQKTLPYRAVLAAAASHTAYKTALFVFPPNDIPRQTPSALLAIAGLTFSFGAVLGLLRLRQGTIAAPLAFHVIFDLLVYGQYAAAPWWVLG